MRWTIVEKLHDDGPAVHQQLQHPGARGQAGRELRGVAPDARRWKILVEFRAELILFLALSSNADIHAEKLAAVGEFMTHPWALLTHAGILEHPSNADGVGGNHGNPAHDSPV